MEKHAVILVADDDYACLSALSDALAREGYQVVAARSGQEALELITRRQPHLVLTDLRMREGDGLHLLEAVKRRYPDIPVIMMTAFASMETVIDAIRQGACDYLSKPFNLEALRVMIARALHQARLLRENHDLRTWLEQTPAGTDVVGRSPEMVQLYTLVGRVAPLASTILIEGETGTGKEIMARLIHKVSRRSGPFLAVNCGALPEGLLESELFGHVRGAFTGAVSHHAGLFQAAKSGSCFLDDISNMPASLQIKLLRVLEQREFTPVGATQTQSTDTRIIAATNEPLADLVQTRRFREDLYYRLKVVTLCLPPLRDRRGDIPLLLDYFTQRFSRLSGKTVGIHESVYPCLSAYAWPGNVRELEHTVEQAVALNSSGILTPQDFPEQIGRVACPSPPAPAWLTLAQKQNEYVREVLAYTGQNISRAAEILKIDRKTLYRFLRKRDSPDTLRASSSMMKQGFGDGSRPN